jgi:hypothetical protein
VKLNCGLNISKLVKDIAKGKPKKPSSYVWASVSQSVMPKKK